MGVYIKGMKMPESCCCCTFFEELEDDSVCTVCHARKHNNSLDHVSIFKRADWCPLIEVPKHGRLIDADLLFQHILLTNGNLYANVIKTDFLDIMPTIIEAEYPPSIPFDKMWKDLKKQDPFFVEVEEEVKKLKAEGKL